MMQAAHPIFGAETMLGRRADQHTSYAMADIVLGNPWVQQTASSRNPHCEEKVGTFDIDFALVVSPLVNGIYHFVEGRPHVDGPSMACLLQPVRPVLHRPVIIACAFDEREA